jgi:hypothetical protein
LFHFGWYFFFQPVQIGLGEFLTILTGTDGVSFGYVVFRSVRHHFSWAYHILVGSYIISLHFVVFRPVPCVFLPISMYFGWSCFFLGHSRICFGRFCSVAVGSSGFFGQFYGVSASLFPFLVSLVLLQLVLIFFGQIKRVFAGLVLLQLVQTVFWLV